MDIGKTFKFIREKKGLTQKEMTPIHIDTSTYSRVEGNKRIIKLDTLTEILDYLSIDNEEFFHMVSTSTTHDQKKFRNLYYLAGSHLGNKVIKKQLLDYLSRLETIREKSLREQSNYIAIKCFFHQYWQEVSKPTTAEVMAIYDSLIQKDYYFQYDYILISNLISYFSEAQRENIIRKSIPIQDEEMRDHTTKKFAYNTILNMITVSIHNKEYEQAKKYISLGKRQDCLASNYSYRQNLQYLSDLLNFLLTSEPHYFTQILHFIEVLKNMGDSTTAEHVENELKSLTQQHLEIVKGNDLSVGLIKES